MKQFNFIILLGFILIFSFSAAKAQNENPPQPPPDNSFRPARPNLLGELGLSQEQIQQIQRINIESRTQMRAVQERVRTANRNLDQAVYADDANDSVIQERLKEVQAAQAEAIKIRINTEFEVRKVLTPEQLIKFREIRQKFAERMNNRQNFRGNRPPNMRPRSMRPNQ